MTFKNFYKYGEKALFCFAIKLKISSHSLCYYYLSPIDKINRTLKFPSFLFILFIWIVTTWGTSSIRLKGTTQVRNKIWLESSIAFKIFQDLSGPPIQFTRRSFINDVTLVWRILNRMHYIQKAHFYLPRLTLYLSNTYFCTLLTLQNFSVDHYYKILAKDKPYKLYKRILQNMFESSKFNQDIHTLLKKWMKIISHIPVIWHVHLNLHASALQLLIKFENFFFCE